MISSRHSTTLSKKKASGFVYNDTAAIRGESPTAVSLSQNVGQESSGGHPYG